MTQNARQNLRVRTSLDCIFGPTTDTPRSGTVTSLSFLGCFIKTKGWATKDQKIFLRLWLPEERWLRLQGVVIYHLESIGFGLTFTELGEEEESALTLLVSQAATLKTSAVEEEDL